MAIIRKKELNALSKEALASKLLEVRRELNAERGLIKSGGRSSSPGKIKELRRTIARILTKLGQKEKMLMQNAKKEKENKEKQKNEESQKIEKEVKAGA